MHLSFTSCVSENIEILLFRMLNIFLINNRIFTEYKLCYEKSDIVMIYHILQNYHEIKAFRYNCIVVLHLYSHAHTLKRPYPFHLLQI